MGITLTDSPNTSKGELMKFPQAESDRSRKARKAGEIAEEIRLTVIRLAMEAQAEGLHVVAFLLEAAALEARSASQVGESKPRDE